MASTEDDVVVRLRLKDVARFIADVKSGKLAIDDLEKKISKAGRTAAKESESSGGGFGKLAKSLGFLKWYAVGAVGSMAAATGGIAAYAIKSTASLEQVQVAFTTLLHSSGAANQLIGRLQKFATATPFELAGVEESTQKLLSFGFTAQNIIPTLTAVGNAASGLNLGQGGMDEIITALGQMRMKGRVQGDELLQLAEHGVNAYGYLQRGLKLTPDQLQKAVKAGKVSAATAIPLILKGMDSQFKGLMDKESHTLGGIWSNLHDAAQQGLVRITSPFLPAMKQWLQALVDRMPQIEAFLTETLNAGIAKVKVGIEMGRQVVDSIKTAISSGDWGPIGAALGTRLRDALVGGGSAAGGVDWFDIGKKVAGGAIGFVLGFAVALFDPGTWWPVIQKHWLAILIGIVTAFPIGRGLGLIAKVLERVPLARALAPMFERAGSFLTSVGGPIWKMIAGIGRAFGRAFLRVFPQLGTEIWYWFTRIGEFFTRDGGLLRRVSGAISGFFGRALEGAFTVMLRFIRRIGEAVGRVAGAIWRPLQGAFITVLNWLTDKWEAFIGVVTGAVGAVTGAVDVLTGTGGTNPQAPSQIPPGLGLRVPPRNYVPGQASGGSTVRGGMSWVGERGPELLNLPRGAQVIPLPRVGEVASRGPIHVHVMVDKREIAQAVYDDMGDRVARR